MEAETKNLNVEISAAVIDAVKAKANACGMKLYAWVERALAQAAGISEDTVKE